MSTPTNGKPPVQQDDDSLGMIDDRMSRHFASLTPAERQLAIHLTRNYPIAGLSSMTVLAKAAGVSSPTVLRLVQKLGFRGYPEFQTQLHAEVEARLESPIAKHARWIADAPQTHVLNRFADAILANLTSTLSRIDHAEFDACADMLADPKRRIMVTGGRITHALAEYLVGQLGIVRPGVTMLSALSNRWPPALLDLRPGDVLIVFDIRRYENTILSLTDTAAEQGAEIVLLTDPWVSPAAGNARFRFSAQIEVPSAWDSNVALLVLVEALLAAVLERTWDDTETRMKRLESLYDSAGLFRRGRPADGRPR
ncbi:MurR/RpiR family transcriptional regulator [Paracoccus pacificus]|uniref:MurR/RpiR family transcriptional regulator n=1 Tax=Paracoccus pacificus TaxID=1463598 RepID=A0ABW4R392_9RHOB